MKSLNSEKGSALLIVFVFAAMVAIMLYMEMPVAMFEAKREKEQLLIDRGNEYKHAVKLFVRKVGTYPGSLDALENTNRMRFLRHRFKDPFTGKDDWRLLHAGPGGMIIDSKVNQIHAFGNNPSTTSTNTSNNSSNSSATDVSVAAIPQRPPAIPANGSTLQPNTTSDMNPNTLPPLIPNDQPTQAAQPEQASVAPTPGPSNPMQSVSGLLSNPNSTTSPASAIASNTAAGASASSQSTFGQSTLGRIISGGIAGVASIAKGHTIKKVNDQSDYSLWEFYYDPSKDAAQGLAGALPIPGIGGSQAQPASGSVQSTPTSSSVQVPQPPASPSDVAIQPQNNPPQ